MCFLNHNPHKHISLHQIHKIMIRPSPYCDGISWRDKKIKPNRNEAFVASSGDIITDYNDLYCLVASRCVNMTISVFVIRETTHNKHYSTLLKTRVWLVSRRNVFTGCESEAPDCPCKVGFAPLYRNRLCAKQHCRLLFQVQETVLWKLRVHTLIFGFNCSGAVFFISSCVLFWKPKQSSFGFTMKHNVSTTWCRRQQQYYSENNRQVYLYSTFHTQW